MHAERTALRRRSTRGYFVLFSVLIVSSLLNSAAHADPLDSQLWSDLGRWFDPRTSPFIPIPEIATNPNAGTTIGFLPVFLSTDEQKQIRQIIAPDLIYNPNLGVGGHFRLLSYPSEDTQWHAVVGAKQIIERELDLFYSTGLTRQEWRSFTSHLVFDRDATDRFFGVGNASDFSNQTNYTMEQAYLGASFGVNFSPAFQIALQMRPRFVRIERGAFESLPFTGDLFPGLDGLGSNHEFLTRLFIAYDTRDSILIPTQGSQVVVFAGVTDRSFLSSVSYALFGLEARHHLSLSDRLILATHAALRYMPGGEQIPFWALSSLGGGRSVLGEQQPLRGFGEGRFVDNNLFVANLEFRTQVFETNLFSTRVSLELAPFIDIGQVFHRLDENPFGHVHVNGGLGFRGVAKPFVVGRVDFGYGGDGLAIFSGIDYPF